MNLIDLSHEIEHGMITYKALPAPIICDYLSRESSRAFYEEGTEFQIGKIEMVANTGTYVDCPFHRFSGGKDLSEIGIERFADIPGVIVHTGDALAIDRLFFEGLDVKGKAVLVHTGWSRHWRTDQYFESHPFLTPDAAEFLRKQGATIVGIDSHNIDDTRIKRRPVHTILLEAEILIVEHLCNLHLIPKGPFFFSAVPPKFKGVGTFPVRAFAAIRQ